MTLELEVERLEWEADSQKHENFTKEETQEMFAMYAKEDGHLCVVGYFGGVDQPGQHWTAWCVNCRESTMGSKDELDAAIARIDRYGRGDWSQPSPSAVSWTEAKMWTRNHRAEHGLPKQELAPCVDLLAMSFTEGF